MFCSPSPCLLGCFLASADYSSVSSDFVVALGGFFEAGFTLVVRVELDGNSGLVLVSGGLLACLTVLEKHGFVLSSGGASFLRPRCLYILYGLRVLFFASFPIYGDENTISGLAGLAVLLAWCSCVGRLSPRLSARYSPRRSSFVPTPSSWDGVVIIGSSLAAACLSCLSPRFAVPVRRRSRFALLRVSCCLPYRSTCRVAAGSSLAGFSLCLLGVWCRIALLPVLSDKTGGAMLLRRSGDGGRCFSSAWVSGLALLSPFIRVGGAAAAMRRWRANGWTGGCVVCSLALGCGAMPSFLLVAVPLLLRLIPLSCFSLFLFPFRPTTSCGFSLACWPQLVPRPPGVGCANGRTICGCGRDGDLLACSCVRLWR